MSGKYGDAVFRQMKDGSTIIARRPDFSNRQFSQDQLTHQDKVKLAAAYGKAASKEHPIYAKKAEGTNKNAYNVAFKDWFHALVLHGIRHYEERIRVDVTDDVMVALVTVTILDPEGNVLERGDAEQLYGAYWEYQPVTKGRILVEACDLPGNVTEFEFCQPPENRYFWEQSARPG
ncbi:MAG: hypothetical protein ACM3XO_15090 [Bacteroidota bacterium]